MTHTKCPQCGLNNWHGAEVCERCASPLDQTQPEQPVIDTPPRPEVPVFLTLGAEPPARSRTSMVVLAVIITLAVGGGAWAVYKSRSAQATPKRKQLFERTVDERTRDTVLSCLAYPGFVGTKVSEQVIGPVHLEMLQVPDKEVYFSAPAQDKEPLESLVARFIIDAKRIVMAE